MDFWQVRQWQLKPPMGLAKISYLTAPQRQPPVMGSFMFFLLCLYEGGYLLRGSCLCIHGSSVIAPALASTDGGKCCKIAWSNRSRHICLGHAEGAALRMRGGVAYGTASKASRRFVDKS